jgi:hypothetical protein
MGCSVYLVQDIYELCITLIIRDLSAMRGCGVVRRSARDGSAGRLHAWAVHALHKMKKADLIAPPHLNELLIIRTWGSLVN